MAHMTLMTGPERRRRWSEQQRVDLLTAAFGPGGKVAEVARRADVCTSLLYRWRRARTQRSAGVAFMPAVVETGAGPGPAPSIGAIVVELAAGARVTINATAPASLVSATLRALR
jgi:transposase